jgi:hypothetical protein
MAYNGWSNYETWNVALWFDNDEGLAGHVEGLIEDEHEDAYALGQSLKGFVEEIVPEVTGMFADLLGAAISEVNWQEIAEHYIADYEDDDEDEDAA